LSDFEEMDLFFSEEFLHEWLVRTIPLIHWSMDTTHDPVKFIIESVQ
jgi:hypothetical protein